ncbi:MAG: molybdopterin-binding protein [Halodesulfurarchaeum sp.]|nr:molybdopterin-binding protein [Halodesulfurarchaeum sp.]
MDVGLLTVGDELLSGETENTNASWLARRLSDRGATLRRIVVVPDEEAAIVSTLEDLGERYDAVIVTGGLGPTHDDVTMEAVATAFDCSMRESPDAAEWIQNETEYELDDLVPGTTHLPDRAEFLPNPAGVAPGAHIENVYVLPGVPAEMREMFELIAPAFDGPASTTRVLTADRPERELVSDLKAANERFDVRIGSYPGEMVTIRIQGLDGEEVDAATAWLEARL